MRRQIPRAAAALALAMALLLGLIVLGQQARRQLQSRGHYSIPFRDFQCNPPAGQSRQEFLAEVQYLGSLPDAVDSTDPTVLPRMMAAFSLHPWVERVMNVTLRPPFVSLALRAPVLAVNGRAVDGQGILLPPNASLEGLVVLYGSFNSTRPAGSPWGDGAVEQIARIVAELKPFQEKLKLDSAEIGREGLILTGNVRVQWGRGAVEPKIAKLRELLEKSRKLPEEIDLR